MEKIIKTTPLYRKYVLKNNYSAVVQVGGRFSGKSHNEQIRLVSNLGSKQNYKLLVIEDLETGMSEGFHAGLYDRIRDFEHEPGYTSESKVAHIKNILNGNTVQFRGYTSDQQKLNVKKLSGITEIVVEEGEWMTYDDFMGLYQQLRGGKEEDRKLTILLNPVKPECFANKYLVEPPPDVVLEYFKCGKRPKVFERHITTKFKIDDKEVTETIKILVVLSTHFDNNHLNMKQRASIEQYRDTDPDKYLQLGEARFIRPSGTFFKEFDTSIHVVEPFIIPDGWYKFTASDYGLDMEATLWFAIDYEGNCYCYKESYKPDLIISEACEEILRVNDGDYIETRYGPPDLMARNRVDGKTTWEMFAECGWELTKSDNRRDIGALAMKEWLKVVTIRDRFTGETVKTSRLKFFNNCENIIRTLPQLLADDKDANKYATEPHELTHTPDALRYFCVMRECIPEIEQEEERDCYEESCDSLINYN